MASELTAKSLMKVPSEAEVAAQKCLKVERMLQAVREEQESLERERQDMQRRLEEGQNNLQQERDRLRTEAYIETPQQCRLAMSPRVTKLGPDYPRAAE